MMGLDFTDSFVSVASLSRKAPVISLNGVSKVYFAPGWRIGYMAWHDPENRLALVRDGVERILRSRLCASTPAQYGYLAGLQNSHEWLTVSSRALTEKRMNYCLKRIKEIDGISCESPSGAFYLFVRLTES